MELAGPAIEIGLDGPALTGAEEVDAALGARGVAGRWRNG